MLDIRGDDALHNCPEVAFAKTGGHCPIIIPSKSKAAGDTTPILANKTAYPEQRNRL